MVSAHLKENLIAVCLAALLAWWIFFVVRNTPMFQANIASGIQQDKLDAADIVMNLEAQKTDLVVQRAFSNVASVSMLLFVDEERLKLEKEQTSSNFSVQMTTAQWWWRLVVVSNIGQIDKNTALVSFAGEGDQHALSISDVLVTYTNNQTERLALGTRVSTK